MESSSGRKANRALVVCLTSSSQSTPLQWQRQWRATRTCGSCGGVAGVVCDSRIIGARELRSLPASRVLPANYESLAVALIAARDTSSQSRSQQSAINSSLVSCGRRDRVALATERMRAMRCEAMHSRHIRGTLSAFDAAFAAAQMPAAMQRAPRPALRSSNSACGLALCRACERASVAASCEAHRSTQ